MKHITKEHLTKWEEARSEASVLESDIMDRVEYVIKVWIEAFGGKLNNWYFDDAREGEMGSIAHNMNDDSIYSIYIQCNPHPKNNDKNCMTIIDKDGDEYSWQSEIPTRWLFEDCEQEIIDGKKKFEEKQAAKKIASKTKKLEKASINEKLAASAMKKLSKEELNALMKVL